MRNIARQEIVTDSHFTHCELATALARDQFVSSIDYTRSPQCRDVVLVTVYLPVGSVGSEVTGLGDLGVTPKPLHDVTSNQALVELNFNNVSHRKQWRMGSRALAPSVTPNFELSGGGGYL